MDQFIYWHAPLWEVLLMALASLAIVGWLVARALRRPDLPTALAAINPTLSDQPLFFFDRVEGIKCLNAASEQVMNNLPASVQPSPLDTLMDTLLEAHEEGRIARQSDWPQANSTLIAAPIFEKSDDVAGVLALVITEMPSLPVGNPADEPLTAEKKCWLTVGPTLRLHLTRPVVQVKRVGQTATGNTTTTWQEYQLGHIEETLLRYLIEHHTEVQTAETLFSVVWPDDEVSCYDLRPDQKDRLRRLVFKLRQHVEPDPRNPRYVCTAHGVGYALYPEQDLDVR